jgi:hypothetical protein
VRERERERAMATTSGNIKEFYRQRKNSGVAKPSSNNKKPSKPSSSNKKSPKNTATFGSDITQPSALISSHLKGLSLSLYNSLSITNL